MRLRDAPAARRGAGGALSAERTSRQMPEQRRCMQLFRTRDDTDQVGSAVDGAAASARDLANRSQRG
jgi:hypothetical protein